MKFFVKATAAAAIAFAVPAAPAFAQEAGQEVVDTAGNPVGVVVSNIDGVVTIRTDQHDAVFAANAFTPHEGKLLFGLTRAEVNAAAAEIAASIAVGKSFKTISGVEGGTIDQITDEYIQLKLADGRVARIPATDIRGEPDMAMVFFELADLEANAVEYDPAAAQAAAEAEDAGEETAEMDHSNHEGHDTDGAL